MLVSTEQGVLGSNMFAYCLNNPVNGVDPTGTVAHALEHINVGGGGGFGNYALGLGVAFAGAVSGIVFAKAICSGSVYSSSQSIPAPSNSNRKPLGKIYTVYYLQDIGGVKGEIKYVGRVKTENYDKRMRHHRDTRNMEP